MTTLTLRTVKGTPLTYLEADNNLTELDESIGLVALSVKNINDNGVAKLSTARTIAGVSFNGTANINIPFEGISTKPNNLAGYGITDAMPIKGELGVVDLDNITSIGIYHQSTNAEAASGANYPLDYAGKLEVYSFSSFVVQVYQLYNNGRVFSRGYNGDNWSVWAEHAPIASPALTGTPTAPTAVEGTNTTQIATTAFVQGAIGGYLSKSGLTGGTITLTDAEVSNAVLYFSGVLTSNLIIVVPTTNRRLWVAANGTTGAFTTTVKTSAGTGVTIAQGKRNLIYTDGTNVQDAFNDFESIALTGTPTAPTATAGTNSTQIATTKYVDTAVSTGVGALLPLNGSRAMTGTLHFNNAEMTISHTDTDMGATRYIRSNGGDIGFLDSAGGWTGRSYNNGDWVASGNVSAYSDIRIKTNIVKIDNALEKVSRLTGYTFDRTDVYTPRQTGLIAQELQEVLPEAVTTTPEGILVVAYGNIVGLLVEAIKEQNEQINALNIGMGALRAELALIKKD